MKTFRFHCLPLCLLAMLSAGCATVPYRHLPAAAHEKITPLPAGEAQVARGEPNGFVDTVGQVFGIPARLLLANGKMDKHQISPETEAALAEYLAFNGLTNVKVRINQYAPGEEFGRIVRNKRVGAGWRYTFGMLSWLVYTILPQRILGGDNYNPYSDTINLYSDLKVVAIHEGGHAKDFASRTYPGTYAFLYALPFVALYHEGVASTDAMSYFRDQCQTNEWERGYKTLYPAYGTYVGGSFSQYLAPYEWVLWAGLLPGHAIGRLRAAGDYPCAPPTVAAAGLSGPVQE